MTVTNQDELVKALAQELGIDNLPEKSQEELIAKATETLIKRIYVETLDALSSADQERYLKLLEGEAEQTEIDTFLHEKISNYDQFVAKIINDFKQKIKQA